MPLVSRNCLQSVACFSSFCHISSSSSPCGGPSRRNACEKRRLKASLAKPGGLGLLLSHTDILWDVSTKRGETVYDTFFFDVRARKKSFIPFQTTWSWLGAACALHQPSDRPTEPIPLTPNQLHQNLWKSLQYTFLVGVRIGKPGKKRKKLRTWVFSRIFSDLLTTVPFPAMASWEETSSSASSTAIRPKSSSWRKPWKRQPTKRLPRWSKKKTNKKGFYTCVQCFPVVI